MGLSATEVCSGALCPRFLRLLPLAFAAATAQDSLSANGRRLAWSSFTAESSNPTAAPAPAQEVPAADLSDRSSLVVAGIVETFLHKIQLEPGELDCLKEGTGKLAGEVTSASENAMMLAQQVLGGKNGVATSSNTQSQPQQPSAPVNDGAGSISAMVDSMQAEDAAGSSTGSQQPQQPPPVVQQPQPQPAQQQEHKASKSLALFYGSRRLQMAEMAMSAPLLLMNLGYSVHHIADLTKEVVKKCVKGDALRAFQLAGHHLRSLRYMEGRLIANGADVVTELADALQSYQKQDFKSFGHDMGRVFRKVLLSQSADGGLPEGLPGKMVMANVTAGVMRGFFGEGFALNLQTQPGYDPLHIDLHECVGKNLAFFQSLWSATMLFYAKKDAQGQHSVSSKEKPSFGATLALTMMQMPTALRKCNIGHEEEQMLMDSIKQLGSGLHYEVEMPDVSAATEDQIASDMATTVKDWARTDYYTFGLHLGHLLQELFVTVNDQKWSVDHQGTLRKRLLGMAASQQPLAGAAAGGLPHALQMALVAAVPLLAGLVALRSMRSRRAFGDAGEDPEAPQLYSSEGVE